MCYADTCFLLALILESDCWKDNAERIRGQASAGGFKIWACETTFIELLYDAQERDKDPVRYIRDVLGLVECDRVKPETILKAALYIRDKGLDVADSMIAAHAVDAGCRLITSELTKRGALKSIEGLQMINLRSPKASL